MHVASSSSDADWAALLAAERARCQRAEAALAAAHHRLAALEAGPAGPVPLPPLPALLESLPLGLVLVHDQEHVQVVNQYGRDLFGQLANTPQPTLEHLSTAFADPAAALAHLRALFVAGQPVAQQPWPLADGRVVELDYLGPAPAPARQLLGYRNVTERYQREAEMRRLAYIPQQTPTAVLCISATDEVSFANPAAAPLVHALATDAAGSLRQELLALRDTARQAPAQRVLAASGQYYLGTARLGPDQEHTTLYLTNITDRHLAEQQLTERRVFYESILEQLPIAISVLDADQRYLFANTTTEPDPAMRAWMMGKTMDESCAHRQRPAAIAEQRRAAFAEMVREQRGVVWEENHPERVLLMQLRPVISPGGQLWAIGSGTNITKWKQAEEKIARQQEFYESVLNLLPVDVAVFDAEHRFLFVNPSSISDPVVREQIIGLSSNEYFELRRQHQPHNLGEQRQQYFDLAVRTHADVTWEEMRIDSRNRPQLIMRHLRPVYNADDTLRLVVGSGIDITARYTAEKLQQQVQMQLREQQAFIRQIVDTLPNVLYMVAPDNSISFSNRAYHEMMAYSQHQQGEEASPQVQKELRDMRRLNKHVRTTLQDAAKEMPFTCTDGDVIVFNVHKRPMLQADGQVGILTISTDVTAMKLARQELERREKQYHDLVYYSQALICTHDPAGRLLSVNPAIERLMDMPANKLVGRHLREAIPPQYHAALQAYLDGNGATLPQPRVVSVFTSTGERRYLNYYSYRVDEADQAPYIVASGYDVTSGVLAERALREAKREAEENALAKEAFLARMSHEIRTPLNGVLGMAALLKKTSLTDAQREYLTTMQHAGQHLLALVNDVLDMAKITAQNLELNSGPFDVAVALQGAGQTVAPLATQKGLNLTVEPLPTAPARVVGDAYRLHQVLLNLLSNAIKFTARGSVRLGTDVLENTPEELKLRFWVADTGIGMTPDEQEHIFEAFAQASAETSQVFGGTGLGLSISRQLVDQMGGILRLCSEPGEGTTFAFVLTLPRAPAALPGPAALPAHASFEDLRGLRVLLAEDNLVNQRIAVAVLENWGVHVHAVDNGLDALAQLEAEPFDVALLDIRMPGLSGVEVTEAVRHQPGGKFANIPIVALTANAFTADRATYLAAGMNACLTKPYEEAALCQLLLDLTRAN